MNASDPVEIAFTKFLTTVGDRRSREQRIQRVKEDTIRQKDLQLIPIRKLLKRLVDLNLVVSNASRYAGGIVPTNTAPVSLAVTEGPSSPSWAPGNSLYLEHPAELEIAIPNDKDTEDQGIVVIRCSTDHPDSSLFNGPFRNIGDACEALAEFLARNTEHMNSPDVTL